jgi:glycine cleavage system T protein (aminomethyltransferase)
MADTATAEPLLNTPLHGEHAARGARMVPFAGYAMPVQYPTGILAEHQWTRENAGLFDVSHMGQAMLAGPDHDTTALALETLVPADILGLPRGRQRYALLLNEQGGIRDDLMVARPDDPARDGELYLVVNASTKEADYHYIEANLPDRVALHRADNRALLALQGPRAETALARHAPEVSAMAFMDGRPVTIAGMPVHVSRSGYTGEDGFEISVPADEAVRLWRLLLQDPLVKPIGLGARDSLRLEAGLCLYGQDVNQETSPVEAALAWTIPRRRRQEGGFPGEIRITQELAQQPLRLRVGLRPEGRVPAREGAEINDLAGELVGEVTSGGFGPTVGGPVAMGYVVREFAEPGTALTLSVRGKTVPAEVVPLPFVPHRYRRR